VQDSKGIVHGLREVGLLVGHFLPLRFVLFAPILYPVTDIGGASLLACAQASGPTICLLALCLLWGLLAPRAD